MQKCYCFIAIVILSATVYTQTKINNNLADGQQPRSLSASSPNGIDLNNDGVKKALNNRYAEAAEDFRKAVGLLPACHECRYNLARALARTGGENEAIEVLKNLVAEKSDFKDAYTALGDALSQAGEFEEGIAAYRKAIQLGPADAVTLSNMGHSLEQAKQHDEALRVLDEAVKLDPHLATAHSNRGVTLFALGKVKESIESFRAALALDARSAEICNNLGVALDKLGKKEAHHYFEEAVRIRPDWGYAVYNLGVSNLKRGERDTARSQLSSLEKLDIALADSLRKQIWGKFVVEVPKTAGNSLRQ